MPITPKDTFDAAIQRPDHLLRLYDLVCDTRYRNVRGTWAARFKDLMRWPASEEIVRIDGKDGHSLLIARAAAGIDRSQFGHEYASELLRAAVVATVSALDRYMHDLVVHHSWSLLGAAEADVPRELKGIRIPLFDTKRAVEKAREAGSRPGYIVKQAVQAVLHREHTFQGPDRVLHAANMLGLKHFWDSVAAQMPGAPKKGDVLTQLRSIVDRRNQIVHEADLVLKTKAKQITVRDISRKEAGEWCDWIRKFVKAIDEVVAASL